MANLATKSLWNLPTIRIPSIWEELVDDTMFDTIPSGLSISEDNNNVYVDAALPGIDPKDVDMTFERGVLRITGEIKEEEKDRKHYRKATSSFSYKVVIPETVDWQIEPLATYKNGMVNLTFKKTSPSKPKKIELKVA